MGVGAKFSLPIVGSVAMQYVPKVDGSESADKTASGNASARNGSGFEIVTKTSLGDLPFVGDVLGGNTLTLGYAEDEVNTIANTSDGFEATVALTGSVGNLKYGYQVEHIDKGQITDAGTDAVYYRVDSIGLAYAVNESLSISYNMMEQSQHNVASDSSFEQETDAINIGYTVGGLTLGFQDASTDHANMVKDAKDDTRTISIKAAF